MWDLQSEDLKEQSGKVVHLLVDGTRASYARVMNAFRTEPLARQTFLDGLASLGFTALFWEVVPVCRLCWGRPFECAVLHAPDLESAVADPMAFAAHFRPEATVVQFPNLGGDAQLIAPAMRGPRGAYSHLAMFLHLAPIAQRHRLLRSVGDAVCERLSEHPLWLSTSGLGVSWLHVRLDARPKYYQYRPYRRHAH